MNEHTDFTLTQIGVIHSCYKEKFGIPRTSNLVTAAEGEVELFSPWGIREALQDLEGISHIWLSFKFHTNNRQTWSPTVRPPRLGGNKQIGVFATRSPIRPNPLGLSVVRYAGCRYLKGGRAFLKITGLDLVDGTPVYDIKPYVCESDMIERSTQGWIGTQSFKKPLAVSFSNDALVSCQRYKHSHPQLQLLIEQVVSLDPRPAYKKEEGTWGVRLYDFNIRWRVDTTGAEVFEISRT